MSKCFLVGDVASIALILYIYTAGFFAPLADSQRQTRSLSRSNLVERGVAPTYLFGGRRKAAPEG
jgi:hypothetical protein